MALFLCMQRDDRPTFGHTAAHAVGVGPEARGQVEQANQLCPPTLLDVCSRRAGRRAGVINCWRFLQLLRDLRRLLVVEWFGVHG